jgi:hypothetical protein
MPTRQLTCRWCKAKFRWPGRGRRPRYCKPSHRQRAFEQRSRDLWRRMDGDMTKELWEAAALRELEGVLDSPTAMRAAHSQLSDTIKTWQVQLQHARLKKNILNKRVKDAPKTHAQLAREMRRSVEDALGAAEL